MKQHYDHADIEAKWNKVWDEQDVYTTDIENTANKFYCLDMFPYPSGEGLHVGHWRGYVLSDFYARYMRLQGKNVLHPMGFDAFGLPAERAAIKNNAHPKEHNAVTIPRFISQLKQIGASYDWSKNIDTSSPEYYKWTQWLFLQLYKHGLAEKRTALVNWCPEDKTVLANEQVVDGKCERCGSTVTKKEMAQWFVKTTALADELIQGLEEVEWPEHVKTLQRNWIGRSEGATVGFAIGKSEKNIEVFTTRPDTIFGVTALVLAPEHPSLSSIVTDEQKDAVEKYLEDVRSKTNIDRQQQKETEKTAVFTGSYVTHPLTNEEIPVWVADYVLMEYGTGAVMCVPAHDERDFQFAKTHNLPIKQVIAPSVIQDTEPAKYRPEEPVIRGESVIVFIKHPTEDKYLGLDWKESAWGAKTVLTGTIDDLSPEETVLKEIREETGYKNAKITEKLGVIDGLFYHLPKKTNKLVRGHVYLVQIENEERDEIEEHEAARHEIKWLTAKEMEGFLTPKSHQFSLRTWLINGYQPFIDSGTLVNSDDYDWLKSEEASEKIVSKLAETSAGSQKTTYRLRDWLVSRQRYWGAPIPIVYDPEGKPHPVKEEHLPLLLPEDVDFTPGGESPIASSKEYQQRAEELYGAGWHFETDTLDTFVDSSWYYLRYLTPNAEDKPFDKELVKKWLPVDLYIGGIEHATLHLLYARFITRFLSKYGYIDESITEPFKKLFNIGMITLHGAKMSKSKGNIVSPDPLIEHYGTDALRGYELFVGPMDVEAEWNVNGINGIHRFLIKLWQIEPKNERVPFAENLFNQYLSAIEPMIKDFRLNTYISEAMKFINEISKSGIDKDILRRFISTLSPIFPYIAEEIWHKLGNSESVVNAEWPKRFEFADSQTTYQWKLLKNNRFVAMIELPHDGLLNEEEIARVIDERISETVTEKFVNEKNKVINVSV